MNRNLYITLLIITTYYGSFFGMEKPKENNKLKAEDIALRQADIFYFGLDNQERDFKRACNYYKRAAGKDANIASRFLALHMLSVMAFAQQGEVKFHQWEDFINQAIECIRPNNTVRGDFAKLCSLRVINIFIGCLKTDMPLQTMSNAQQQLKNIIPYYLDLIIKPCNLFEINKYLRNKKRCPDYGSIAVVKELPILIDLSHRFYNHLELNKTSTNEKRIAHFQELLTIESKMLRKINTEIVINLANLFYLKKVNHNDMSNTLDALQKATIFLKNKIGFPTITEEGIQDNKKMLKLIGSLSLKRGSTLNFERAREYLQFACKGNFPKRIADGHIAVAESYLHGLGTPPDYQKALQFFLQANHQNENKAAQARSALSLGYMYFCGDTKNNNVDATQPNYQLAKVFAQMAYDQKEIPHLIPSAENLLAFIQNRELLSMKVY